MKNLLIKAGLPLLLIGFAILIAALLMMSRQPPEQKEPEKSAFLVDVQAVSSQAHRFVVTSQGSVKPKVQSQLVAQVSGRIVAVSEHFVPGGMFKKGDLLVSLEQADFITELKLAEAELARATASLHEEQARGKVAEEEWRNVKNTIPSDLALRKPQLEKEQASVLAAEAQVERAKRNLQRTEIRAPFDGLLKSKMVDLGQFVNLGSQLATLYATDVAEVRLPLTDNDLRFLGQQQFTRAEVVLSAVIAGETYHWPASLVREEGVLDEGSRVLYAVAQVQDPYQQNISNTPVSAPVLSFGRFVQAELTSAQQNDLVVLPRNVVRLDSTVLVVDDSRKLEIRPVQVQRADDEFAYISQGLQSAEQVVISTVPNPVQGMAVRLVGDEPKSVQPQDDTATSNHLSQE